MVEKLASTEIAQSRERFEKWADDHKIGAGDGELLPKGFVRETFGEIWQAAERDTRERCAQSTVEYLKSRGITMTNKEWDELAERIRGKV